MERAQQVVVGFLLSLLLFGMQLESQRHAIEHLRPLLTRAHDVGAHAPADQTNCIECGLLASGSDIVATAFDAAAPTSPIGERKAFAYALHVVPAPAYFQSRAPPSLL